MSQSARLKEQRPITKEAVLDSNLLLLWLVDGVQPSLWKWKRIQMFEPEDAVLLRQLLARFSTVSTTPHVLTEASNFANQLSGFQRDVVFRRLGNYASETVERFKNSALLASRPEFVRFGITDCGLSEIGPESTVITMDFRLAGHLHSQGKSVLNFNHLRQSRLLP